MSATSRVIAFLLLANVAVAQEYNVPFVPRTVGGGGGGGPTVDATSTLAGAAFPTTPRTWSHTNGGTANLLLMLACLSHDGTRNITGFSYNSVAASEQASQDDGVFELAEVWMLASPATGTNTVSFGFDQPANHNGAAAISFIGASATLRSASGATGTGANPAVTGITTVSGDVVVGILCSDNESGSTTPGGTEFYDAEDVSSDSDYNAQYVVATGTSTNLSWTSSGSGSGWSIAYAVVKP